MRSAILATSRLSLALVLASAAGVATRPSPSPSPARARPLAVHSAGGVPACTPRTGSGAGTTPGVPITLEHLGSGAAALVGVCVHGSGPFEFIVDSGSSISVVDPDLASRFGLVSASGPIQAAGIGCPVTITLTTISHWSLGAIPLASQVVAIHTIPTILPGITPAGIVGSDVLARFGAARLDYRARTLSFEGPEGPLFEGSSDASAPSGGNGPGGDASRAVASAPGFADGVAHGFGKPNPGSLTAGSEATVQGTVSSADGRVTFDVPVRVGTGPTHPFLVDTGAEISLVSPAVASSSHLAGSSRHVRLLGIGCPVELAEVRSGPWAIGRTEQPPQLLGVLANASSIGIDGDLGSDTFLRYGAVVVDYRRARLVLAR